MNRVTKNLVGLAFWLGVSAVALITTGFVVMANYLACKTAFELLGFEMRPLKTDEIMGPVFEAFLPEATLAHFYALALTATLALGYFLLFRLGAQTHDLWQDRAAYIAGKNQASAEIALKLILANCAWMLLFAIVVGMASAWDFQLFRYRSVAGAMGIDDPLIAASTIKGWEFQLSESGHIYAWSAARWGAFGYLGVTILACLSLEFAFRKTADSWEMLLSSVEELFQLRDAEAETNVAGESLADTPDEVRESIHEGEPPAQGELFESPLDVENHGDTALPENDSVPESEPRRPGILWRTARSSAPQAQPAATATPALLAPQPAANPDLRDVIGADTQVTLGQARTNPERYHIDTDGQIWLREHWEQLHGLTNPEETEAA